MIGYVRECHEQKLKKISEHREQLERWRHLENVAYQLPAVACTNLPLALVEGPQDGEGKDEKVTKLREGGDTKLQESTKPLSKDMKHHEKNEDTIGLPQNVHVESMPGETAQMQVSVDYTSRMREQDLKPDIEINRQAEEELLPVDDPSKQPIVVDAFTIEVIHAWNLLCMFDSGRRLEAADVWLFLSICTVKVFFLTWLSYPLQARTSGEGLQPISSAARKTQVLKDSETTYTEYEDGYPHSGWTDAERNIVRQHASMEFIEAGGSSSRAVLKEPRRAKEKQKRKRNIMNETQISMLENQLKVEPDMQRKPKLIRDWTELLKQVVSFSQNFVCRKQRKCLWHRLLANSSILVLFM